MTIVQWARGRPGAYLSLNLFDANARDAEETVQQAAMKTRLDFLERELAAITRRGQR